LKKTTAAAFFGTLIVCYIFWLLITGQIVSIFTGDASWSHSYSDVMFVSTAGHWFGCTACGDKKDYSSHIAGDGVCSVCKFVLADDEHTHSFTTTKHDSVGHWSECDCGERSNLAFHTYGEWVVNGDKQSRMCSVCSCVNTVNVPVEEDNEDKEDDPVVDNNNDVVDDTENNSNSLVVGIISAVSAIAITLIADFAIREILKKSKWKPEHVSEETNADDNQENTEETN
jgi:hypothetical protein